MYKCLSFIVILFICACTPSKQWPIDNSDPDDPCTEVNYIEKSFNLKTKKDYRKALYSEGMNTVWKYFEPHMLPEIRIHLTNVPDATLEVGTSKVGGLPDLPNEMEWPTTSQSDELIFLAQLNFQELNKYKPASDYLPKEGLLSFFFASNNRACRRHFSQPSCFKTIYTNDSNLSRRQRNDLKDGLKFKTYPSCQLKFEEAFSLPLWNYEYIEEYASEAEDCAYGAGYFMLAYMDIRDAYAEKRTKLFGHANEVQGEMRAEDDEWMILFQLDSERSAVMEWNDSGHIFFWIKKTDLAALNFDNMEVLIQGY